MALSDDTKAEIDRMHKELARNRKLQEHYSGIGGTNSTAALAELCDEERRINEHLDKLLSEDSIELHTLSSEEAAKLNADIAAHPENYRSVSLNRNGKLKHKKIKTEKPSTNGNSEKSCPAVLVWLAKPLSYVMIWVMTLYTLAVVVVFFSAWQIYKLVSADGWQAILHTKYSLYIIGYFVIYFILKKINAAVYAYAHAND
jgi:hypothetical protein